MWRVVGLRYSSTSGDHTGGGNICICGNYIFVKYIISEFVVFGTQKVPLCLISPMVIQLLFHLLYSTPFD